MKLIATTFVYTGGVGAFLSLAWGRNGEILGLTIVAAGLLVSTSLVLFGRVRQA